MPNEILIKTGTAIILADVTDHSPSANNNLGSRTVQIDLTGLASGAARQSAKFDFGAVRADLWYAYACLEFLAAEVPAAGESLPFYIAPSPALGAAVANPGGVTGSDSAYTGTAGSTLAESLLQLDHLGTFKVLDDVGVQISPIGVYSPLMRYGSLIVFNNTANGDLDSDAVQMSVLLSPTPLEVQ